MRNGQRLAAVLLCAWCGVADSARGQQGAQEPRLQVATRLVVVDVIAKDRKGQAVEDLRASDFTVLEDGKPQRVAVFRLEKGGPDTAPTAREPSTGGVPAQPEVFTNRLPTTGSPAAPTVLLLDSLNTPVQDQMYAREQLLKYLKAQLGATRPAAVYALGDSLRILQDLTEDSGLLKAAVEEFLPSGSRQLDIESRMPLELREAKLAGMRQRIQEFYADQAAFALGDRVRRTCAALESIARRLAGYPGRKAVVWVSASFPFWPPSSRGPVPADFYRALLVRTTEMLNDARIALYPVDARGLVGATVVDASIGNPGMGPEFGQAVERHNAVLWESQVNMKWLASSTGGLAMTNRNDLDGAVAQSVADGAAYYVLGYYPQGAWNGKFRRIRVRVQRKGVELRYRHGYYALDAAQWGTQSEEAKNAELESALRLTSPPSTLVLFEVRPHSAADDETARIALEVKVDLRSLVAGEVDGEHRKFSVSVHAIAFRPDGTVSGRQDAQLNTTVTADGEAKLLQEGLPVRLELALSAGRHQVRVGVRDLHTGRTGTVDVPVKTSDK